ncbi:hypothetical protein ACKKBF_B11895 [Auxenochlorella protothecoides x Auxenochlorella symbiontica]
MRRGLPGLWAPGASSLVRWVHAPGASPVLSTWLEGWEAGPPVELLPGDEGVTALSWLRRRGPDLPASTRHRLLRTRTVRAFDPGQDKVRRVGATTLLPPGARLLVPRSELGWGCGEGCASHRGDAKQERPDPKQHPERGPARPSAPAAPRALLAALGRAVLHVDPRFVAVNKPAGLATQGGPGIRWCLADLARAPGVLGPQPAPPFDPGELRLVHRLDRGTSGVVLLARGQTAAAWLSRAMAAGAAKARGAEGGRAEARRGEAAPRHTRAPPPPPAPALTVEKRYLAAVAVGAPDQPCPEARPADRAALFAAGAAPRVLRLPVRRGGEESAAESVVRVLEVDRGAGVALLDARPVTGRQHQLRQHCARALGAPILGDRRYGARAGAQQRGPLFLHCAAVRVRVPDEPEVCVAAPPPPHWEELARARGWRLRGEGAWA